jgi:hypothetical protein
MSCGFLYILGEDSDYRGPTGFSKIGITESKPWERLRKLQQGNPRDLEFTYLWVGPYYHVNQVESIIKYLKSSEWFALTPQQLRERVIKVINENNFKLAEVIDRNVPYKHHSYGRCKWHKNRITPTNLYEQITGGPVPNWRDL